jgi:hypothetical protein
MITVPDAQFVGGQGYFPVSLYMQGKTSGKLAVKNGTKGAAEVAVYPNPASGGVNVVGKGGAHLQTISIMNTLGAVVYQANASNTLSELIEVKGLAAGLYTVHVTTDKGVAVQKLQIL